MGIEGVGSGLGCGAGDTADTVLFAAGFDTVAAVDIVAAAAAAGTRSKNRCRSSRGCTFSSLFSCFFLIFLDPDSSI